MTPSITGGTGHLQQTAGLRSERECWGNFLSRQAGLRNSGHPSATPPPGGSTGWWGEISLSFFFLPPFFIYLFIYLYRVSPRWGEALGRNKMSFFQEKIFLTKKNIFRPGANALLSTLLREDPFGRIREAREVQLLHRSEDRPAHDVSPHCATLSELAGGISLSLMLSGFLKLS